MKHIYLVRHCKATGQEPKAPLTQEGQEDAEHIAEYFIDKNIDVIYSSPFLRALETIKPYSVRTHKEILIDKRLKERILSTVNLDDWMQKLEETYENLDLKLAGGESSNEATHRVIGLINELQERPESNFILVTHGALLSLIIKNYQSDFGFEDWKNIKNPDIYLLKVNQDGGLIEHSWV
ncbi:histidine phosphatase family protein [Paenibacillus faecalis]|uniref:histidine phosphatase family protein n=1 Tax=Paenibacillus faecalis TaxID=2079532 RepID=UPI000D0EA7DF|nr:histidine phosphatase family protein [Paenibacillus faecalis]